jgi:hypothetical protein
VLVSLTPASVDLVRVISKDLEAHYRELERKVGPDIVERVYRAVDDLLAGLEDGNDE